MTKNVIGGSYTGLCMGSDWLTKNLWKIDECRHNLACFAFRDTRFVELIQFKAHHFTESLTFMIEFHLLLIPTYNMLMLNSGQETPASIFLLSPVPPRDKCKPSPSSLQGQIMYYFQSLYYTVRGCDEIWLRLLACETLSCTTTDAPHQYLILSKLASGIEPANQYW